MAENWAVRIIYRIATGRPLIRLFLTPLAPLVFAGIIVTFVYLALLTDRWLQLPWIIDKRLSFYISIPVMLCGMTAIFWCLYHFLHARGTPVPFNPPKSMVTSGPYRYSRNPMLTGLFMTIFGLAFTICSLSLLLFFLPIFIVLNYFELKHIEEPELEKRFGQSYVTYKNKTPIFLPRLKKK